MHLSMKILLVMLVAHLVRGFEWTVKTYEIGSKTTFGSSCSLTSSAITGKWPVLSIVDPAKFSD